MGQGKCAALFGHVEAAWTSHILGELHFGSVIFYRKIYNTNTCLCCVPNNLDNLNINSEFGD